MRVNQFLEHHGIVRNPFAEEDAQTDPVFKEHCIESTYHPTWDKVYGDPSEPASSIVFGEKGAGKTAMRLQLAKHLDEFNGKNPAKKLFVIHYDDFNPFLDRFREKVGRRQGAERVLKQWKLWDHMDAILSIGITGLVDHVLETQRPSAAVHCDLLSTDVNKLDRHQARDLLLLAACYDQSTNETFKGRWNRLRRRVKFWTWKAQGQLAIGIGWTVGLIGVLLALYFNLEKSDTIVSLWWLWSILFVAGWVPFLLKAWQVLWTSRGILARLRTGNREPAALRHALMQFTKAEMSSQPLPNKDSTDDRYELLLKFQGLLSTLGFKGIIVLLDRVDEPHLINGQAELMKFLIWPILDNKFLKHPGMGIKLMLPIELTRFIDREDRDFYQRARLDKQNMIPSFEWTGEALYDVAVARVRACAGEEGGPALQSLFDPAITSHRLIDAFRSLRVPRRLFKFLYRLLVTHCNQHTDENPVWQISPGTFESTLALAVRDGDAFDRGMGSG